MRITKANVDEMKECLDDILNDIGPQISEAADTWLEDGNDADERRDARDHLTDELDNLKDQLEHLVRLLS